MNNFAINKKIAREFGQYPMVALYYKTVYNVLTIIYIYICIVSA